MKWVSSIADCEYPPDSEQAGIVSAKRRQSRNAAFFDFDEGSETLTEERGMPVNITYSDLIQLLIFIAALVSLCYQIFRGKK